MSIDRKTREADAEVLETYFEKYPDVPKETILKQHMLSLGHWFSDAALDAAAGVGEILSLVLVRSRAHVGI